MTTAAATARRYRPRHRALWAAAIILGMLALVAGPFVHKLYHPIVAAVPPASQPATGPSPRQIVFIVPGTYGNEGFWPNLIPGKATFASELQRALGDNTVVYPCLWYAANDHSNREAAAKQLATIIDEKAAEGFEKIFLVGHSHGGNIALWAAGLAHHPIDAAICLSTPEVYLSTKSPDGRTLELPVYCSEQSRKNISHIVTLCADTDAVPDVWSDAVNGINDNVAIAMTRGWREHYNHPRLREDGMWAHAIGDGNVKVVKMLTVADANVTLHSFVKDRLGVTPHYASHSRRMGYVIGDAFRQECSDRSIEYLQTLLQPVDSDQGGPVDKARQEEWVKRNESQFTLAGWRLNTAKIQLETAAGHAARNTAGDTPEPYLRIQSPQTHQIFYESPTQGRTYLATWQSDFILWKGPAYLLGVYAQHDFKHDTTLGNRMIAADMAPPSAFDSDIPQGIFWSGEFTWTGVHY